MTDLDPAVMAGRFAAQLLTGPPAASAVEVVSRLLAVQGQDPRGARLAVRARSAGLTAADVDRALTTDRSLLITWLNRGTLHLVTTPDYWWLHALTMRPQQAGNARRLAQEGVPAQDADKAVAVIDKSLAEEGPLTRAQLGERIASVGVRSQGQALVHLLYLASARGIIARGPMAGREHAWVRVADWLGARPARFDPARFDRTAALGELARRFLKGHGPASDRDLAIWAGLPLRDARSGLEVIAGELSQRDDGLAELASGAQSGAAWHADLGGLGSWPPPRLLGPFDPLLHGWVAREPVLGPHKQVVTVNGLFRPFALAGGRAVATWSLAAGRVTLSPFAPLPERVARALATDAEEVIGFLGS